MLADDDNAAQSFDAALGADMSSWPFQRGRLLLAHGRWLRRRRATAESRGPLRAARDTFNALGCEAWADQAKRELRASGESSRRRDPSLRDALTAQELQIAHLAAEGLSNQEIGEKLFVSRRTVSTHLYRIYSKLRISTRGGLASALKKGTRRLSWSRLAAKRSDVFGVLRTNPDQLPFLFSRKAGYCATGKVIEACAVTYRRFSSG